MAQDTFFSTKKTLNIRGNAVSLERPFVMGIINTTPDSFYSGSRSQVEKEILLKAEQMIEEGATFLDIGGYSSRPGSTDIAIQEELERVVPAIKSIRQAFPEIALSIDTFRSKVARSAVEAGADIINDISGGDLDANMFETVSELQTPYILMHMRGTPQNMNDFSDYDNLTIEIIDYFQDKLYKLNYLGVRDIILDPGFGFAKTIEQNFDLLKQLQTLQCVERPLLVGLSRKSMIYKTLNIDPEEALNGTTALNVMALVNGASILRVHDVKAAVEAIKLYNLTYLN